MDNIFSKMKLYGRILLLGITDSFFIILASFLTMFIRTEFVMNVELWNNYLSIFYIDIIITLVVYSLFNLYRSLWEFASMVEMRRLVIATLFANFLKLLTYEVYMDVLLPKSWYIVNPLILFAFTTFSRFMYRNIRSYKNDYKYKSKFTNIRKVMIVGAGEAGNIILREIILSKYLMQRVVCFIDDDKSKIGSYMNGVPIVGDRESIHKNVKKYNVDYIYIALPSASNADRSEIINICKDTGCKIKMLPGIYQLLSGEVNITKLKDVEIEDLLGRDPIKVDIDQIASYVKDKVIMVTGGGGSIGSELCRQIASHNPKTLIIVDIYENNAYDIQMELKEKYPELDLIVRIASIRDGKKIDLLFDEFKPEIVYHAAAHKHVPLMEDSPNEAIKNNVFGTLNVVKAADKYKVKRFVQISTDKAVNPTNIMGATKRMCEMIIQSYNRKSETEYTAVRFGNVLGSNGSVIPLFKKQIAHGGPVTVTHKDIIRYFMTIPEAVSLVIQAGVYAKGGEIFVLDMGKPVRIDDLARNLIKLSGYTPDVDIKIEYTGLRPGEKLFEELLMNEEGMKKTDNEMVFIGKPIDIDDDKFYKQLDELREILKDESDAVKDYVSTIVPTYKPYKNGSINNCRVK